MARAHVREPQYLTNPQNGNLQLAAGASVQVNQPNSSNIFTGNIWSAASGGTLLSNPLPALGSNAIAEFWLDSQQDVDLVVSLTGYATNQYTVSALDTVDNASPTIADGSVTTSKLAAQAVATANLADLSVTTAKIATAAVTAPKIPNGTITPAHLSATGTPSASTYLRGDGTWSAGTASSSIASASDANVSSPADGNLLVFHTSDSKWHNDKWPERTFEFFGGSLTGTLAAQTTAYNAFRTWADAAGGGVLVFGPGTYQHLPKMELGDHEGIRGQGFFATRLQFDSSITSGSLIFNHVSTNGTTDPNAYACSVENVAIDGTQLPGWGTNATDAIVWDRNPRFGSPATADSGELGTDCFHRVRNVFIKQPPRDGVVALAMGEQTWENIRVYNAGRYGFQPPFDSTIVNCCAGLTRQEGWFITGQPVKLIGCKAFSCGNDPATRANGQGFHIKNGPALLIGCEAQDNYAAGFWVDGVGANSPVTLTGCVADSNGVRAAGGDPGYDISNSAKTKLSGCVAQERRADGVNSYQQNAVSLRIDSTGCSVDVTHMANNGATIGSPFLAIGTGDVGTGSSVSFLNVNNIQGLQSNFAASLTPDFFAGGTVETLALAANATVNAPTNGPYPKGARAEFIFQQDATGGRTITWNTIYKNTPTTNTAANAYTVARFRFDGTNWVGI